MTNVATPVWNILTRCCSYAHVMSFSRRVVTIARMPRFLYYKGDSAARRTVVRKAVPAQSYELYSRLNIGKLDFILLSYFTIGIDDTLLYFSPAAAIFPPLHVDYFQSPEQKVMPHRQRIERRFRHYFTRMGEACVQYECWILGRNISRGQLWRERL